ncbi:MAG: TonB family protein [Pseudolabrys sp.]|nr:TonB family protein [Pseudolabrys sp.]
MIARRAGDAARWSLAAALALGLHVAGACALLAHWHPPTDAVASAPAILIELSPAPAAPEAVPTEVAPGPARPQADARPEPAPPSAAPAAEMPGPTASERAPALPLEPAPRPATAVLPPPKPAARPATTRASRASLAAAPSPAPRLAARTMAPTPGARAHDSRAIPNWKSALVAQLERHKRYPAAARGEQGVAELAFSVDRAGGVHDARVVRSSGSALLDRAAVDLVISAAPLPPPPPEIAGARIPIVVPVRYEAR